VKGLPTPALDRRPELREDLLYVWSVFFKLSALREYNQAGPQRIALIEFTAWCDLNEVISSDLRQYLHAMIAAMDSAYVKVFHDKAEKRRSATRGRRKSEIRS